MTASGRRPLVSGNWKMHKDHLETIHTCSELGLRLGRGAVGAVDVSIHPPFTDLRSAQSVIEAEGVPVSLGAQNCATADSGAFTGEVSAVMLARLRVEYVIVGHSERRTMFGEDDEVVAAKLQAVFRNGMVPICCVGEHADERDAGRTTERLQAQITQALGRLAPGEVARMVIAYEPVWAIGSGQPATPEDAQEAAATIRGRVTELAGAAAASGVRILYGGSVGPDSASPLVSMPDVDGLLVGGASLDPGTFTEIVGGAAATVR
ncbi:MAG: triose-phosphate isomerase [Acidimicrobiales bacterium]|nr:triose-phosphate isomerase [Actinomycetota bacterium]